MIDRVKRFLRTREVCVVSLAMCERLHSAFIVTQARGYVRNVQSGLSQLSQLGRRKQISTATALFAQSSDDQRMQ
jgi:hypothetical protein